MIYPRIAKSKSDGCLSGRRGDRESEECEEELAGKGFDMMRLMFNRGIEFPLAEEVPTASEEGCQCQKKRDATAKKIALVSKSRRNCQSKSNDSFTKDSYEVPTSTASTTTTDTPSGETGKKSGRTVTLTAEDMQKKKNDVKARTTLLLSLLDEHQLRFMTLTAEDMQKKKNDVKARTTLLLSLLDEHQLRFSQYKTAQELWAAILKTFDGNEATKKTKKNLLKQQYGNFKAEGLETLEQTFNRLQVIVVESRLVEYKEREVKYREKIRTLEFRTESNNECIDIFKKKLKTLKQEKEGVDGKQAGLLTASKDLENLIKSQRADKNKEGLGYSADLSWTGLPEFADDTVTDYIWPSPTMESTSGDDQNRNPSVSDTVASPITPKPFIKFVKPKHSQSKNKTDETETPKKPPVKYAEQYIKQNKKPNVRENQRNWNNLKSQQLGIDFVMKKKACFNYGNFNHLAYDCRKRVKKSFTPKPVSHRPYRPPVRPVRTNMNAARPNRTSFNKQAYSYANRPFYRISAVRSHYRAPWVPTVNRNFPPVNRKFSTGSRNFPTANRKFLTVSRKFPVGSTKCSTADMGMKGKAVKPSACWF
nr:hypothetical protein [Tanacetum cinerariifolium]